MTFHKAANAVIDFTTCNTQTIRQYKHAQLQCSNMDCVRDTCVRHCAFCLCHVGYLRSHFQQNAKFYTDCTANIFKMR